MDEIHQILFRRLSVRSCVRPSLRWSLTIAYSTYENECTAYQVQAASVSRTVPCTVFFCNVYNDFERQTFTVAGPTSWNSLPDRLRDLTLKF